MRKTNRSKKTTRYARTPRKATARKTTSRKTTRKSTRKVGTSKTITAIAKQFVSGMKSGKGFTTVINSIVKKSKKNYGAVCQMLCTAGLCCGTKVNGTKVYWPNFTAKATKNTYNATQTTWCQAMIEWCLATGYCTPRQLQNNSTNQKTFLTFCANCCTKAITGKTTATNATASSPSGAWMTNWSKSNNRTWKTGKTFKFPTYASRSTGKRIRKAA